MRLCLADELKGQGIPQYEVLISHNKPLASYSCKGLVVLLK